MTGSWRRASAFGETGNGEEPLDLSLAADRRILRYMVDRATRIRYPLVNEHALAGGERERIPYGSGTRT